jgi:hypothetical protein
MGEMRTPSDILVEETDGKRQLGKSRRRWRILKWIIKKQRVRMWTGFIWLRMESSSGLL